MKQKITKKIILLFTIIFFLISINQAHAITTTISYV
jgi:hypothetical protein